MTDFTSATPGVYTFTVATAGTYHIAADGAQGGAQTAPNGQSGGAGALVSGDIYLQAGTKLEIVVGGRGVDGGAGGGGGGGSFVIELGQSQTILAVAGGGGGGGHTSGGGGLAAPTGAHGGTNDGGSGGHGPAGGQNGGTNGGGGGGFTGGHGGGTSSGTAGPGVANGAGFGGGRGATSGGSGGVGGGGGAGLSAGGGGGGYGGGGGGAGSQEDGGGGGGGSYLDASVTNPAETAGVQSGNGLVTIAEVVCFVSGTRLLTDRGEVAIDKLNVGDFLVTASGEHRPVRWLGHRRVRCAHHPEPSAVWPIRIQADAFAPGVPVRALWVSPGHSIFVESVLIQADKLVNGTSIVQVPMESVDYWHVELDRHDVIIAEGLTAESYLDTGNRAGFFNNGGAYLEAHPDFRAKHWADTCVPLEFDGATLQKARRDLRHRAVDLGYVVTEDPDLHAVVDGTRVDPVWLNAERLAFLLPEGGSHIELRSRTFIPAHLGTENLDNRRLGICVVRLQIDGDEVRLDDETAWSHGWHALECYENSHRQRWSRDRLLLPAGTQLVVIDTHAQAQVYWCESAAAAVAALQVGSAAAESA